MNELAKMLGIATGPMTEKQNYIELRFYNEFEPHGKASETWEEVWELKLPRQQAHWRNDEGAWFPCVPDLKQKFKAKTYQGVVAQAKQFVTEFKAQQSRALRSEAGLFARDAAKEKDSSSMM